MSAVRELAEQLGAPERTLRRCEFVRTRRDSPRSTAISASERAYLHGHWAVLSQLRRALRTEPNVAMAAVFGSFARGDDRFDSDIDLLVELREDGFSRAADLQVRLSAALDRDVQVSRAGRVDDSFLARALADARLLVDRERVWPALQAARPGIQARARAQDAKRRSHAGAALKALAGGA